MSEPKLCPFRKSAMIEALESDGKQSHTRDQFAPCLQEKCAMWIPEHTETTMWEAGHHEHVVAGRCGLRGEP